MKIMKPGLVVLGALWLSGCNMSVIVDPEGLVCDPGGVCPNGYLCRNGTCRSISGSGGGSGGGSVGGGTGGTGGTGGSGGGAGSCTGLVCNQPGAPLCLDANTLRTFGGNGTCAAGKCSYPPIDKACAKGCANSQCTGDPCNGVSCTTPPVAVCKDASTLTTFSNAGTCSAGVCSYTATNTTCTMGCSNAMCLNQNLCANVTCNMPPGPTCAGNSARVFMAPGTCNPGTGTCSYNPIDTPCLNGCAGGLCTAPAQTFTQTMPRVPFAVRGLDQAPNSTGGHVVVVGDKGNIMKWDGASFTRVSGAAATNATFNAVWFGGANSAIIVGSPRTVARYNGTNLAILPTVPTGGGAGNMMYVHGKDESNFTIADDTASWWRFSGPSTWDAGTFSATGFTYKTNGVWVDASNRARIVGTRVGTSSAGVVHYFEPSVCLPVPCEDVDRDGGTDGFGSAGPAIAGATSAPDTAFLGRATGNLVRKHNDAAPYYDSSFTPSMNLPSGSGITAVTGAVGATKAIYLLEGDTGNVGHLYRYSGLTGVDPGPLAEFYFDKVSMGPTESSGVVFAEADLTNGVNNIYRRNAVAGEMLDLGESWAAVTSNLNNLVLVSKLGDLAYRVGAGPTWQFRRGPFMDVTDATAANGTGALLVGKAGDMERFVAGAINPTITAITGATTDLTGVCRVSDLEAYTVGRGGVIRSINTTLATSTAMSSPTNKDLLAIDCAGTGSAVACGQGATVLKLTGTTWAAVTPGLSGGAGDLSSCRLVGSTLYVAGDNSFYKLDLSAPAPSWQQLPALGALSELQVLAPNDIYALSAGTRVVRFDGSAWNTKFMVNSGSLVGGGQVGGKVVYAGPLGLVVEGQ